MKTIHQVFFSDSASLHRVADNSVALVVTSPPYPMIAMWDDAFIQSDLHIRKDLEDGQGVKAWMRMHQILNRTWAEVVRVLLPGGIACINIGDATRSVAGRFALYPNHASVIQYFVNKGLSPLPAIIWRKQSNKPNKFMGSGMLPPNAYVTLEHEYILIFRKGNSRSFFPSEREIRGRSAIFWEERNAWFSDIWDEIKGTGQDIPDAFRGGEMRIRSAAFPFEIPYRLIQMYSIEGDTILDPFLGTGTTILAALASGRNSLGYETEPGFAPCIRARVMESLDFCTGWQETRISRHTCFMNEREIKGNPGLYQAEHYPFSIVTRQEIHIRLPVPGRIRETGDGIFEGEYI